MIDLHTFVAGWIAGLATGVGLMRLKRKPACCELMRERQPSFAELLMPLPRGGNIGVQPLILNEGRTTPKPNIAAALLQQQAAPSPVVVPVPVSERWPEFSDCDDAERVWCWSWALETWRLSRIKQSIHTHWLPANALPLPAPEGGESQP